MHILLISAGGGGGSILRSVKASFRRDLAMIQTADSRYAYQQSFWLICSATNGDALRITTPQSLIPRSSAMPSRSAKETFFRSRLTRTPLLR